MQIEVRQEDIERARTVVKAHYPEMKDNYSGRRLSIAITAEQSGYDRAIAEVVEWLRGGVDPEWTPEYDSVLINNLAYAIASGEHRATQPTGFDEKEK